MKFVSKYTWLIVLLLAFPVFGQKSSDKLRKEQERLERNINNTKMLLDKTKASSEATLNELKIIENQVKFREELLNNFDNQIRGAELKIEEKDQQIKQLTEKLGRLKEQYRKLIIYAYKHRSKQAKWMFIFSADSYFEAIKRNLYLQKIAEMQQKQKRLILQHQGLISSEIQQLEGEKNRKKRVADEKRKEKESILKDKEKQQRAFQKLLGEQKKLIANLEKDERNKEVLKRKIKEAIDKEIAAAEKARKEKERKEREALAKKEAEKNKSNSGTGTTPKTNPTSETKPVEKEPEKKEITFSEPADLALNKGFESNKGRLPWPVEKGTITEGYGKHAHPTLPNVFTNNNGIDITTPKGASVRAVFEGEVTSVFNIPGAGKVVIVKHGNYRTVYSNLQEVYVSIGTKVSTKQRVGSLLPAENDAVSIAHFEIHQVVDGQVIRLNPSLWVTN